MIWQTLLLEWANFLIRWVHVITGIAWIGSSFYFVHLDLSLKKHAGLPQGAGGDAWQVHGGGFYHMIKYGVAPAHLPAELTWFKWEAYSTFLSGFFMLGVLYYTHADLYLIDRGVLDLAPWQAVAISLATLVAGWLIYDALYRTPLAENDVVLGATVFVFLVAVAFGLTKLFGGRGAFIQLGAIIGTVMVGNVAMNIIPNQRKVVAALIAGQTPDPAYGKSAKQRSLHNNYLTLPVIFLMVSNHYPLAFASRWNWVIAAIVIVIGALIRHFYNSRHAGNGSPWWTWAAAALGGLCIIYLSTAGPVGGQASAGSPVRFAAVEEIVTSRCSMCHAGEPVWEGLATAPKGVRLELTRGDRSPRPRNRATGSRHPRDAARRQHYRNQRCRPASPRRLDQGRRSLSLTSTRDPARIWSQPPRQRSGRTPVRHARLPADAIHRRLTC